MTSKEIWEGLSAEARDWVLNPGPVRYHPFYELDAKSLVEMGKSTPPTITPLGRDVAEYGNTI